MSWLVDTFNSFVSPVFLVLLIIPILYIVLLLGRRTHRPARGLSGFAGTAEMPITWRTLWVEATPWMQAAVLALLVFALARPAGGKRPVLSDVDAVDIVLVLDNSSSMRQKDLAPGTMRIEVVRQFADALLEAREGDRVGLVTFARFSKVVAPLTFDREAVRKLVGRIRVVELQVEDGTAIGIGLGTAVRRLRDSKAKSKVIVLLTDGENNTGDVEPLEAAELAQKEGVRVHTILAGTGRRIPNPFGRAKVIEPGSEELEAIAAITGGQFFRARSAQALERIGAEIDQMERTPIENVRIHVTDDKYRKLAVPAALLMMLMLIMEAFFVRRVP